MRKFNFKADNSSKENDFLTRDLGTHGGKALDPGNLNPNLSG